MYWIVLFTSHTGLFFLGFICRNFGFLYFWFVFSWPSLWNLLISSNFFLFSWISGLFLFFCFCFSRQPGLHSETLSGKTKKGFIGIKSLLISERHKSILRSLSSKPHRPHPTWDRKLYSFHTQKPQSPGPTYSYIFSQIKTYFYWMSQ